MRDLMASELNEMADALRVSLLRKIEFGMAQLLERADGDEWWPAFVWVRVRDGRFRDPGCMRFDITINAGENAPVGEPVVVYAIPPKDDKVMDAVRVVLARGPE